MSTNTVLERLERCENFRTWTFEKPTEVLNDEERYVRRSLGKEMHFSYPLGDGPWEGEPDKVQWIDPETGLDCLIVRNHFGSLCGYVGVPAGHPAYRQGYDDVEVSVHGGLTFDGFCADEETERGICHIPGEGRDPKVWWLGFDCGHFNDVSPGMEYLDRHLSRLDVDIPERPKEVWEFQTYKDLEYVVNEVEQLAKQLKEQQ